MSCLRICTVTYLPRDSYQCIPYTCCATRCSGVSTLYVRTSYGNLNRTGGQLPTCHRRGPGSIPRRFMCDLWCKKWHWEEFSAVAQWLRCCATNRKVASSIPAGISGFFIDILSFRSHYGPGVYSVSNRNEYQEYFRGVKAAGT